MSCRRTYYTKNLFNSLQRTVTLLSSFLYRPFSRPQTMQIAALSLFCSARPWHYWTIVFATARQRWSQWPRGLRRRSTAARLLRLWVRIPPGAWMFVCCDCCVLSGRGLCDGLITRPEESYRLWRVVVCDQEASGMRRLKPTRGL